MEEDEDEDATFVFFEDVSFGSCVCVDGSSTLTSGSSSTAKGNSILLYSVLFYFGISN
jgi:hypothetical protein